MPAIYNPPNPNPWNWSIYMGVAMPNKQFQFLGANKVPVDFTGYTLQAEARMYPSETLSIDLAPEWIDASIGKGKFPAKTGAETDALTQGEYHYELILIDPDGVRSLAPIIGQIDVYQINTHLP